MLPGGAQEALTLHSFFSDTNQIQQHKHTQGQGVGVYVTERQMYREMEKNQMRRHRERRRHEAHEQNAFSFHPKLRTFDNVFSYLPLRLSLIKRAITCPGRSHIKQTLVLSAEPDSAKLHCFQMPVTKTTLKPTLNPLHSACLLLLFQLFFSPYILFLFISLNSSQTSTPLKFRCGFVNNPREGCFQLHCHIH